MPDAPTIPAAYAALIESDRVSANTRAALMQRATPDDPAYVPTSLGVAELATLRAVMDRVVPQPADAWIDLAARIDAILNEGVGDGWRFARLLSDVDATRAALHTLDAAAGEGGFAALDAAAQDTHLSHAAAGTLKAKTPGGLDPQQMKLWFEDTRGDAVRLYVSHPATMARLGYSGIGYGGDGEPKSGFVRIGIGERDDWEPEPWEPEPWEPEPWEPEPMA